MIALKVLIVDDSRASRVMIKSCLKGMNIKFASVTEAENGEMAVAKYRAGRFDLVLMDIHMPKMDGYEAADLMRKHQSATYRRTPIIALTAMDHAQAVIKTKEAGFSQCVKKPVNQEALERAIKAVTSCMEAGDEPAEPQPETGGGFLKKLFGAKSTSDATEQESLREVRSAFIAEKHREITDAIAAIDRGDPGILKLIAFRIKGEGANFGLPKMSELGTELVDAIERYNFPGARKIAVKLLDYLVAQAAQQAA